MCMLYSNSVMFAAEAPAPVEQVALTCSHMNTNDISRQNLAYAMQIKCRTFQSGGLCQLQNTRLYLGVEKHLWV